jgi:Bacterial PH domain
VNELSFRGKDRYHPSWPEFSVLGLGLAVEGVTAFLQLGAVGFCWLVGGTAVAIGVGVSFALRSSTRVGPAGITICWGLGRGRTYPWQEIRWIDVRRFKGQFDTSLVARITLANGKRRSLPALQHSARYPSPHFDYDFRRVVDWWQASTDPAARFQPPERLRSKLSPTGLGVILGLVITVIVGFVVIGV